jgi:hypothetical protein
LSKRDLFAAVGVRSEADDDRLRQFDEFIRGEVEAAVSGSIAEETIEAPHEADSRG